MCGWRARVIILRLELVTGPGIDGIAAAQWTGGIALIYWRVIAGGRRNGVRRRCDVHFNGGRGQVAANLDQRDATIIQTDTETLQRCAGRALARKRVVPVGPGQVGNDGGKNIVVAEGAATAECGASGVITDFEQGID